MSRKDNRWCLICNPRNRTLYWHQDKDTKEVWCWCNKCQRGYSLDQYCHVAGIDKNAFLSGDFFMEEAKPDEVQAMAWPSTFIPLSDPRAVAGVEYLKKRGLTPDGDMYFDTEEEGIVFPYYLDNHYCGAQIRFLKERENADGSSWKITTVSGTRLGLLFYGWNQSKFMANIKGVVVTEGAFNCIGINQALNTAYGSISNNPWRAMSCSGSGATTHHKDTLRELVQKGYKVVIAPDTDEAGMKMLTKFHEAGSITHFAFTMDPDKDWNKKLEELGHKDFAKFFISCIKTSDAIS
jgi:hypothetical protein